MGQVWDVECEGRSRKNFTLQMQERGLFLRGGAKEATGSVNKRNNQIGGMKFINSPHFEAGRKLRNRGTLVSQYGQEGHP